MAERLYSAKAGPIDPIALVNEYVAVWLKAMWHCYKVDYVEPMPRTQDLVFDQGALAALAQSGDVRLINLDQQETPPGFIQLRCFPLDDIQVEVKVGRAESRFTAANIQSRVDRFTEINDPCLHTTEFVVLQQNSVYVNCINPTAYATAMSRVAFFGYRYMFRDLNQAFAKPEDVKKSYQNIVFVPSGSD